MKRCAWTLLLCMGLMAVSCPDRLLASVPKPFTVKDSIEMTTFSDPYTRLYDPECKTSPDGKYVFLVTTRGVLRTNQIVSALWIYSTEEIGNFLHDPHATQLPPHLVLRVAGTPIAQQVNSYGSLITKAQWSMNSQSILALAERKNGYRHVVRIPLSGKAFRDLTPENTDVKDFAESDGTIAYTTVEHMRSPSVMGARINNGASDLTGLSLLHILFPNKLPDPTSYWPGIDLWVRYKGSNRQINDQGRWYFPASASGLRLSISPDGKALVAAQPVLSIQPEWTKYHVADNRSWSDIASFGSDRSGKSFYWPWQYVYVDLDKMIVTPLVDAPSGTGTGYIDTPEVAWSPDGRFILFTNTYLPSSIRDHSEPGLNTSACAAAIYSVSNRTSGCIARALSPADHKWLTSAQFGASPGEVILHWSDDGKSETEAYEQTAEGWKKQPPNAAAHEAQSKLKVFIHQDIDVPPALWAAEPLSHSTKQLWNPNPQLSLLQLGHASVYTWKDSTGFEWHAGLVLPTDYVKGHRYPLVIQTHGFYNEHEFLVDGSYTTGCAARPLAATGIVVFQIEDRADRHTGAPDQEARMAVEGVVSAIRQLDAEGLIDSSRIGIIGFSRTAWYVEDALIQTPHLFRAATLIDGIDQSYVNYMLFAFSKAPEETRDPETANGGKPFGIGIKKWLENAPGFNLDKVETPVRIEAIGPISVLQEWELYSSLFQQGKPVDLIYIPTGQHILQSPQDRYASQQGNVDWFRFWLQGYQAPTTVTAPEYLRWGELLRSEEELESQLK
jgi:dipeptidyl aminopeptidase/acylaminoacyl peptidase